MSYADPYPARPAPEPPLIMQGVELKFRPRSRNQWMLLTLPVIICGLSWLAGGIPRVTDLGFGILTLLCLIYVAGEFIYFPKRFGVGGILLYGGVLIWFCHDYMSKWFLQDINSFASPFRPVTIAKAACLYSMFILFMSLGLRIRSGGLLQWLILAVPEPSNEAVYFIVMMALAVIGFAPFFIWVKEPFYAAIFHGAFSTWSQPVAWTVTRSGNLNYNWGGYVAQILQVGEVGGIFGGLFAVMISTRLWSRLLGLTIWLYWCFFNYNGGRRGELAFMVLPIIAMLFIKYQTRVAMAFRGARLKTYIICGGLAVVFLAIIQLEGTFRGIGLQNANLSDINLVMNQGNSMFTEGLVGYQMIPEQHDFFSNHFPGEGLIRPLPEQFFWFVIGPIPRAFWTTKPVDPLWEWYNKVVTGDVSGREGTTISKGLVGTWYFNYGLWGIVEGGLLVGWLMGISERCLQRSGGRPMGVLMSMGLAVWLFRIYRDFIYIELYAFIGGALVLTVFIYCLRFVGGAANPTEAGQPALDPVF